MKRRRFTSFRLAGILLLAWPFHTPAQTLGATALVPNLESNIDRPLRYRPEGADFVIENGREFFNRPLYGGNTAFRVDGGDKPEFVLYLPGRGGNLRLGLRSSGDTKWLHNAERITTRYRPGELLYDIRDPLLGPSGVIRITALAYHQTEGLILRLEAENAPSNLQLIFAYGGANGERGTRDGDIGTERVPISQYFQLQADFCKDQTFSVSDRTFTLRSPTGILSGVAPAGSFLKVADATYWNDLPKLLAAAPATGQSVLVGQFPLPDHQARWLSIQRTEINATAATELPVYREVTARRTGSEPPVGRVEFAPAFSGAELPERFAATDQHFAALRSRVSVDTPDLFLNAAMGALNVAADAVWDEPQQAIMHGAIAWRAKLLGWRGPYALDALGWHDRARSNLIYWAGRQNTDPVVTTVPPPDEKTNLARNEGGLHRNGDLSNSHYDMNVVYIDALFRHLLWIGDRALAMKLWPVIARHLAWERRLFRREFGPQKLPLYEAYAVIWASDDLQYSGGGTAHASAYNYWHNRMAARLAPLAGVDPAPYSREAELIARAMRELLWQTDRGMFGETKDWLGLQRVHPSAALWTFYHTMDSELTTPTEAWQMSRYVDASIPHLPVRGPGVPTGLHTLGTTPWMPYDWSINNVVMAEAVHGALGFWQAGRPEEAWRITKGSLLAAMFMGISPGNVGSMSYLDVYRRESQRDFADGSGVLSRALIEGLFGIRPDGIAGELLIAPGFPAEWDHAKLHHPDIDVSYRRDAGLDSFTVNARFPNIRELKLKLPARGATATVTVNGSTLSSVVSGAVRAPRYLMTPLIACNRPLEIKIVWHGAASEVAGADLASQPPASPSFAASEPAQVQNNDPINLAPFFNDRVTQIFRNEYRSPRSPFVSLALPKQGLGGWAGGVNATAEIDDTGLRAAAAQNGGRVILPSGVSFTTPGPGDAPNVIFTSQWDNYPRETSVPLTGKARRLHLLMAGSTNPMQSQFDNAEVVVTYVDGSCTRLALRNPETWWPIEQDYFIDDFQFRYAGPLPIRIDLKTGLVRVLEGSTFKGHGGKISGGAATVLQLSLDSQRELASLTIRALANDVVIGLMAATLER